MAIRRQVAACVELDADPEELRCLADEATTFAERLEAAAPGKRVALVEGRVIGEETMHYLPFSPIMGRLNPASIGIEIERDGKGVQCEMRLSEVVEGGTGLVHGGVIAAIYDEVLAAANLIQKVGGPTGQLSIRYKRPTPLYELLRFEAWVEDVVDRKIRTRGRCLAGDTVVSEAEAIFVSFALDPNATDWHKRSGDAT